jgi:hypothetical protein
MRLVFGVFICALLFSCGNKYSVPKDVLPVNKMTDVMWDNMLADEMAAATYNNDTANKRFDTSRMLYSQVAQLHHTTEAQFKKSVRYYQGRPDLLKIILDTLQMRASKPAAKPVTPVVKDTLPPA